MGSVAPVTPGDSGAQAQALQWPVRHLYLHLPAQVADDPARWQDALRAEQRLHGVQVPQPSLTSLLVTGEGVPALGRALGPFVRSALGWDSGRAGVPVASWTVELDLEIHPQTELDPLWDAGVHRVALRPLPLGAGPRLRRLRPPPGQSLSTTLDLGRGTPSELVLEARDHLDAGAVAIAFHDSEDRDVGDEARVRVRAALLEAGWVEGDLAFFHAPGISFPGPRSIRFREPVLGLGPGAVSFRHPWRGWNPASPGSYLEAVGSGRSPRAGEETLDAAASRIERIWHALRTPRGLRCPALGDESRGAMHPSLVTWARLGYLGPFPGRLVLTPRGQGHLDDITVTLAELLEPDGEGWPRRAASDH